MLYLMDSYLQCTLSELNFVSIVKSLEHIKDFYELEV